MRLTSLGVCHNLCSEFVLDIGRLKEISTTFGNSMKIALKLFVNINQMCNNHESTYFNLLTPMGIQLFTMPPFYHFTAYRKRTLWPSVTILENMGRF